jgi:arylsulfatase A-like enzyme
MLRKALLFLSAVSVLGDQYDVVFSGNCGNQAACPESCPPPGVFPSVRPNFMFITVDQQRKDPTWLEPALTAITNGFPGKKTIRDKSVYFAEHYIAAAACSPSRATFYTGHYPSLHGVAQTDGIGKSVEDSGIHWLGEGSVPTLGHYLNVAGYNVQYRGKWHVAHRDISIPGTETSILSLMNNGTADSKAEKIYQTANLLHRFGFEGWIGNEPHGSALANTGTLRDKAYTDQILKAINELEMGTDTRPFWLTCSYVNPHDIGVWPGLGTPEAIAADSAIIPIPMDPPTYNEDMTKKPFAQTDINRAWDSMVRSGPFQKFSNYSQSYYYFQLFVDREINKVVTRMASSRFYNNTYIIFTADHGELLLSHGGMRQKWAQAYEEAVHVEFIVHHKSFSTTTVTGPNLITSHIDLLPTFLGLAGVNCYNREIIRRELAGWNTEAKALLGNDLSDVIMKQGVGYQVTTCRNGDTVNVPLPTAAYFMTDDDISRGNIQKAKGIPAAAQPNAVEAIITVINGSKYKYVFYHDHQQIPTTTPDSPSRIAALQSLGRSNLTNSDFEFYNLTGDPNETTNLLYNLRFCNQTATADLQSVCSYLDGLLFSHRSLKRIVPTTQNNPRCPRLVC